MAYDKLVDSAFLEAGLKKVGDSIRAKAGTSELLEFPDAMSAAVDAIYTSEDLSAELAEYTALNAELEEVIDSLPDAGSGGGSGGSIETCTVEVTKSSSFFTLCQYSVVLYDSDTGIYSECFHQSSSGDDDEDDGTVVGFTEVIWSNVVCGTHLYIYMEGMAASINTSVTTSGGAAFVETTNCGSGGYWIECTAPTTAGAVATITVTA